MRKVLILITLIALHTLFAKALYAQVQLPADFELTPSTYALTDFGGVVSEIVTDPTDASNKVVKTIKTTSAETWGGTTLAEGVGFTSPLPFNNSATTMSVRVWSPDAGIQVRLKVENKNDVTVSVETDVNTSVTGGWETLVFDFKNESTGTAAINYASTYDKASIFFNFGVEGSAAGEKTYYWDDVTFGGATTGGITSAPTPPSRNNVDVLSIFSDTYSNVAGTDFNPNWGQSTQVTFEDIDGNETMMYTNFNYQGTQFASALDVTDMETLNLDMWTADATTVNVYLISSGPAESAFTLPIEANQWASYEIPLTAFTAVNLADIIQIKFDGGNSTQTIYLDNIYFTKNEGTSGEQSTLAPIDFEADGNGSDWNWSVFENSSNPPLEIVNNPDQTGMNTSATVAKFTALQAGEPWAGTETAHGSDLGSFVLDASNSTIKIMVWKSVISDVGIKFASSTGWAEVEIKVPNTKINEWEELVFDFSGRLNPPTEEGILDQIIIFPDFNLSGRTQDNIVFFDNITFNAANEPEETTDGVKLPITFEDTSFDWTSAINNFDGGVVTIIDNPDQSSYNNSARVGHMVKNAGAVWGGSYINLSENLDLVTYPEISVTVWAPKTNSTLLLKIENSGNPALNFEKNMTIPIDGMWTEVKFDMSGANMANTYDRIVLIFDLGTAGDGGPDFTWLFDNISYSAVATDINEATEELPTSVRLNHNYPNPFNPTTQIQFSLPTSENVRLDVFNTVGQLVATVVNGSYTAGEHTVTFDASTLSSGLYVYRLQTSSVTLTKKMTLMK
jgi:hypothetical protein